MARGRPRAGPRRCDRIGPCTSSRLASPSTRRAGCRRRPSSRSATSSASTAARRARRTGCVLRYRDGATRGRAPPDPAPRSAGQPDRDRSRDRVRRVPRVPRHVGAGARGALARERPESARPSVLRDGGAGRLRGVAAGDPRAAVRGSTTRSSRSRSGRSSARSRAADPEKLGLVGAHDAGRARRLRGVASSTTGRGVIDEDELAPQPIIRAAIRCAAPQPAAAAEPAARGARRLPHRELPVRQGRQRSAGSSTGRWRTSATRSRTWPGASTASGAGRATGASAGSRSKEHAIRIWEAASGLRADPAALHWWELFSSVKGQAIWVSSGREYQDRQEPGSGARAVGLVADERAGPRGARDAGEARVKPDDSEGARDRRRRGSCSTSRRTCTPSLPAVVGRRHRDPARHRARGDGTARPRGGSRRTRRCARSSATRRGVVTDTDLRRRLEAAAASSDASLLALGARGSATTRCARS